MTSPSAGAPALKYGYVNVVTTSPVEVKGLNFINFNTNKVYDMRSMFDGCSSLKELNINNFNTNNVIYMIYMFNNCSDELKLKLKRKFHKFQEEAFKDYEN